MFAGLELPQPSHTSVRRVTQCCWQGDTVTRWHGRHRGHGKHPRCSPAGGLGHRRQQSHSEGTAQPSPSRQHHPDTTKAAPAWLAGTRVCLPEKNSSKIRPRRKAPEQATPNARDSFINDGPRTHHSRRVELFTSLGRGHAPGKLAGERTRLCRAFPHPPRQDLARCSWVCFRRWERQKTCDFQGRKHSN